MWSQAAKLTASDRASDDEFGISVAVDGETVVVGAHQHDIGTNSAAGAAYVYTKPGGGWAGNITETAKLTASDRASDDEFGISVAADGGTVVVGAAGVDGTDAGGAAVTEAGAAYVFTLNTGTGVWSQAAKLTASDRASDDEFGISVAVDGGTVVAGAAGVDGTDAGGAAVTEAGAAYVFTLNTGTGVWSQAAKLTASDRASDDEFGISVAVDGGTVVAGAAGVDGTDAGGAAVTEAGAAYVFTLNTGTGVWSQAAKLTASDLVSYDEFGISVAVDGGTVVVGAAGVDGTDVGGAAVTEAGAAYVFTLNTGTGVWSPAARLRGGGRGNRRGWGAQTRADW